jgi:ESCRT-II complex subunit VPS36
MASARPTTTTPTPAFGIDRILSTMSVQDSTRSDRIETSLRDLESLMAQASEMVKLASALSSRQPVSGEAASSSSNGPAATLSAPAFTQDMLASTAASEEAYLRELAKELAGLLTGRDGLMVDRLVRIKGKGNMRRKGRGMLGLDEVWCLWNRARGVGESCEKLDCCDAVLVLMCARSRLALIPPKTFRSTLTYLPALTDPSISLRTFRSSAHCVLHTPFFSAPSFRRRLLSALAPTEPAPLPSISTVELALAEDVGVSLAKEMVEELEADAGEVVRDAQGGAGGGERWYRNLISSCTWVELNDLT